jgi:hypothetical protein
VSEAGVIGCLNVESDRPGAFSDADAELLEFFASAAAVSIEKALLHRQVLEKQRIEDQLKVAREVQAGLLPGAPPDLPGYDIAAVALPTGAIGGDYYDYVPLEGERLGVVVADVSGKGIPAALIMATFRAALRTEMRRHAEVLAVAAQLNRVVMESRDTSRFVTAVCGVLEQRSGRFTYVNCGHNPPLLLRASGGAETLQKGGPPGSSPTRASRRLGRPRSGDSSSSSPTGSWSRRMPRRRVRAGAARRGHPGRRGEAGRRRSAIGDRRHPRILGPGRVRGRLHARGGEAGGGDAMRPAVTRNRCRPCYVGPRRG